MSWGVIRAAKEVMVRTPTKIKIPTRGEYVLPNHTARISHHRLLLLYSFKCGQTDGVETPTSSNAAELNGSATTTLRGMQVFYRYCQLFGSIDCLIVDSIFYNLKNIGLGVWSVYIPVGSYQTACVTPWPLVFTP